MTAIALLAAPLLDAGDATRGVGVYPGDPGEDFGPVQQIDAVSRRNLALRRPAWHSSSHDYNLTAQLVTDGIREDGLPRWLVVSTSAQGVLAKHERERLFDGNWVTAVPLRGREGWVQVEFGGGEPPAVDRVAIDAAVKPVDPAAADNQDWCCTVLGSPDGRAWRALGRAAGMARPSGEVRGTAVFEGPARERFYQLQFRSGRPLEWSISGLSPFAGGQRVPVGGPHDFASAWMSAGGGEQWVRVDLGARCTFDRVVLQWLRRPPQGAIEVSDDAVTWTALADLGADDLQLDRPAAGRHVRVLMRGAPDTGHYLLSELEVFGSGGPVAVPKPPPPSRPDGQELAGGRWRVQRASLVAAPPGELSRSGFADDDWVVATVPGTVLASYLNAGALPDPNFGDNQLMISDSFFCADFWYRTEFTAADPAPGGRCWLDFDGINWKADVWLNGAALGRIEGAFTRARFDVTDRLLPGRPNALAVRIAANATPGCVKEKTFEEPDKNGGALGADNPTCHASIGWDWIPTIRGRNAGIWNDVRLARTGPVTIDDPLVATTLPLPDISSAAVTVGATVRNHGPQPFEGVLKGRFGEHEFSVPFTLAGGEARAVTHRLELRQPRLWWPAGYGEPFLHPVRLEVAGGSDAREFQAGVRQFTCSEDGGALRMWVNGRRFIPRGGNWGFPESMLRYRGRDYDAAVRYHRDMHFTMIRNWVGQTGDDEFYQACDRHGIVVWQDFWLANPWDGPEPDDDGMFLRNARDTIARIRHHPSVGLYCGRNEGHPLKPLDDGIRAALAELHPGVHYIPSSADDVVSGHGPYRAQETKAYFLERATPLFHSEMGMPNIVSMDSLRAMLPADALWPQGRLWGLHDFCLRGAQGGESFRARIDRSYGGAAGVEEWVGLAQFVNYEGYRAMFEAQGKNRMGLLIWMSHPTWPSMVWQTYDYYLEPTAGYFGAKKGSEPLHIQWNPAAEAVEVVNYSGGDARGLDARAEVFNLDGRKVWEKAATLDSAEDSVVAPFKMEYPAGLSPVHFIRLTLTAGGTAVSGNCYWRGTEEGNFKALRTLPAATLEASTSTLRADDRWVLTTLLKNTSPHPALMVRVKAVRATSGDRILPVLHSDNYLALMPGEQRTVRTEVANPDTRGEEPRIVVEGFNMAPASGGR